jgi:hypothetical protein
MTSTRASTQFALIDVDGFHRVPKKIRARDGRYGYALHPSGKGNDASAATFVDEERTMVQAVVVNGMGVRTLASGGPQDGQTNTLFLEGSRVRGYWLCPSATAWISGAKIRPENELP